MTNKLKKRIRELKAQGFSHQAAVNHLRNAKASAVKFDAAIPEVHAADAAEHVPDLRPLAQDDR